MRRRWQIFAVILCALALMLLLPPQRSGRMPILTYHHVVPDGNECNEMTVTVSKLEGDLAWLREHGYTTVLPGELAAGVELPEKPVMITFDDGYRSNYELAFPLFEQYGAKAVISLIVTLTDQENPSFCSWDMLREMEASGLVEIGSHSYALHNLESGGEPSADGACGVQRRRGESAQTFDARVLDDIRRSHARLTEELGSAPTVFCFPFGITDPAAQGCVEALFPVSFVTRPQMADPARSLRYLPRFTVTMDVDLAILLNEN